MQTFGSVCSGIEAASVAWHPLGWKAAWLAEIEPFPSAVLAHHYPDTPNLGDMTVIADRIRDGSVEAPDILVGGTPCQAFSVAGARAGLADPRGQLTLAYVDLANAIDTNRALRGREPVTVVWENVPGVLSSRDNAFGCFLGALAGESCELQPPGGKWKDAGCVFGPQRAIAWRILDAQYFGVAQRRRRVFVVASARKGFDPAQVLFEFEGLRRDTAPSRKQREETAGTLASRTGAGGFPGTDEACSGYLQPVAFSCKDYGADAGLLSPTLRAMGHGESHANAGGQVAVCVTGEITHTLKAEGFDASEDGTGRGQPIVACRDVAQTITSNYGKQVDNSDTALGPNVVTSTSAVRRLTPRECERLQGFPDNWTQIPWRNKTAVECPDGPRYKALGNSMAVPCMRWIGERVALALRTKVPVIPA
jgi:DNA (cytosine-5)-methyltransferase 1